MSYEYHNENQCDKCNKEVGNGNLFKVPFYYLDCNDKSHPDISHLLGYKEKVGYRQYYVCKTCMEKGF